MPKFVKKDAPTVTTNRTHDNYYVLHLPDRDIGGTNRAALDKYARSLGFRNAYVDTRAGTKLRVLHGLG